MSASKVWTSHPHIDHVLGDVVSHAEALHPPVSVVKLLYQFLEIQVPECLCWLHRSGGHIPTFWWTSSNVSHISSYFMGVQSTFKMLPYPQESKIKTNTQTFHSSLLPHLLPPLLSRKNRINNSIPPWESCVYHSHLQKENSPPTQKTQQGGKIKGPKLEIFTSQKLRSSFRGAHTQGFISVMSQETGAHHGMKQWYLVEFSKCLTKLSHDVLEKLIFAPTRDIFTWKSL